MPQPSFRSSSSSCVRFAVVIFITLSLTLVSVSEATAQTSLNPLEQQAALAFNPNAKSFSSISFEGTTTWTAGSLRESGTVLLKVSADGSTSETWAIGAQSYSVTTTAFNSHRTCSSMNSSGIVHADASLACQRLVPWFAPWLTLSLLPGGSIQRTTNLSVAPGATGASQLSYFTILPITTSATDNFQSLIVQGTGIALSVNPESGQISQLDFVNTIDNDPAHSVPYQIVFSNFSADGGYVFPHRIQRYVQRTLQADITITSITAQ